MALSDAIFPILYRRNLSVAWIAVVAFIGCVLVGIVAGIPEPNVQDEFSYLLAADTFAHGRLTNPTHPLWRHFETMHVIHQPSYMSKYPPGQGLMLALGQVIGGHPIFGVWLSMAFMAAAICWMLHAWVPVRWAVLGGLLTIVHPYIGVSSYWAQSYWGGALAAGGGALLLGGVRYLVGKPSVGYAVASGIGLAILANTRPYEGLVLSIPVGLGLLAWLAGKSRPPWHVTVRKILLPLGLVGMVTLAGMGWYNHRLTGDPLRLPYMVHEQQYGMFSYFIWQDLPPVPDYRHKEIRDYHAEYELPRYFEKRSLAGFVAVNSWILAMYLLLIGNVFLISLTGAARWFFPWCWRDRWGRFTLITYAFFSIGLMLETVMTLHYWAPITALSIFLIVQSTRIWRSANHRIGRLALYILPWLALALTLTSLNAALASRDELAWQHQRAELRRQLELRRGKQLVVVRYGPNHSFHHEWVYNDADIDGAKVVWARAMDAAKDCELVRYFKDREVWSLAIDRDDAPGKLQLFPRQSCQ